MPTQAQQVQDMVASGPEPSASDRAAQMLGELFGDNWWSIIWSGRGVEGEPSLIMPILNAFNVIVLVAVALVLIYVVGHAFVGSAHEGTPLGKRMHSIWVPVRAVLSISLLSPIPWAKSLSIIQGIVLTFVGFSVQFANMATTAGLEYIAANHGQVIASAPRNLTQTASEIAEVALHNFLIQYHQFYLQKKPLNAGCEVRTETEYGASDILGVRGPHTDTSAPDRTQKAHKIIYHFKAPEPLSPQAMGRVVLRCKDTDSKVCRARQQAVQELLSDMEHLAAEKIRQLDNEGGSPPSRQAVAGMVQDYGTRITDAVTRMMGEQNTQLQQEMQRFTAQVKKQGFVMLGSYFWTLTRFNMALQDQVQSRAAAKDYNQDLLQEQTVQDFNQIQASLESGDSYFDQAKRSLDIAELGTGSIDEEELDQGNAMAMITDKLSDYFTGWTDGFIAAITSSDPISGLAAWGHSLMNSVYGCLAALVALYAVPAVGKVALPFILLVIPPLFLLGFTLSYYLPAVPFIIWITSVFGWIILVLEALVAAPVWAAMHAHPDGEGLAGERGAQGYVIFVQILLRPILMVIGFFFALLMVHLVSYAGEMFSVFFHGLAGNETFAGPVTAMAGIFLGSTVIVILVHKAFHLIFWLPEGITKWIGGQGAHMGEHGDVSESKQTFVGAVGGYGRSTASEAGHKAGRKVGRDKGKGELSDSAKGESTDHQQGEVGGCGEE